jgi:hypothetical protein
MEDLAVLDLVANILQFVEFAGALVRGDRGTF